jgi:hypothetical protein
MSNPIYGDRLKIGKTKDYPSTRAKGISKRTEMIEDFKIGWSIEVPDIDFAKKLAHNILKFYRIKIKREFFEMKLNLAIEKVSKAFCRYFKTDNPQIYKYKDKEVIDKDYQ